MSGLAANTIQVGDILTYKDGNDVGNELVTRVTRAVCTDNTIRIAIHTMTLMPDYTPMYKSSPYNDGREDDLFTECDSNDIVWGWSLIKAPDFDLGI